MQLCAKLGICGLKADGVGLSQGPFDGSESRVRLPHQPQRSSELEVRFKLLRNTAESVQARSSGREVRQGLPRPTHPAKQHRALQERFRFNERISPRPGREHGIELRCCLLEVTRGGGVHRQLDRDALDRRRRDRKGERLPIGGNSVVHPPLFRIDCRERPQSGHAATAVQGHGANRERALQEFACALPVPQRVIVHANSVQAIRLIARGLNLLRESKRAVIESQRLVEVAECVVCQRGVSD